MRRAKRIKFALVAARKTADSAELTQREHAIAPTCEDFVGIGLMAHIPHQTVMRGIENIMQGNRELHGSKVGTQMPARFGDRLQHMLTQFIGQGFEIGSLQPTQV